MPINVTVLTGRLARDPELRKTTSGKSVVNFTIAVDGLPNKDNEKTVSWIAVVAWDKLADSVSEYCHKGNKVGVTGRLSQRTYEDKDGNTRNVVEVIATEVEFLTPKAEADAEEADPEEVEDEDEDEDEDEPQPKKPAKSMKPLAKDAKPTPTGKKK